MVYSKTREITRRGYRLVALEDLLNQLKAVDFETLDPENSSPESSEFLMRRKKDISF